MDAASIIKAARRRSGLTGKSLAANAGTSASTLSAYEHGTVVPSVATLDRILRASGHVAVVTLLSSPVGSPPQSTIEQLLTFVDAVPASRSATLEAPIWPRGHRS